MAKCDLCGGTCGLHDLTTLLDGYQVDGIKDICRDCERWASKLKGDMLLEIGPKMRAAIRERVGLPPPAPAVAWWRRSLRTLCAAFTA